MANLITNTGFETDTSDWYVTDAGITLSRTTGEYHTGAAAGSITTPGSATNEGIYYHHTVDVDASDVSVTSRCWVKGSGIVQVWAATVLGVYKDVLKCDDVTLTGTWQQIEATVTFTQAADGIRLELR